MAMPYVAAFLSLIPGAGHLYLGKFKKAVALAFLDIGIAGGFYFLHHNKILLLTTICVYCVTAVKAAHEAYLIALNNGIEIEYDSKSYVVLMLLITGFNALPLLWQNKRFTKKEKIAWSIAVPLLFALFFGGIFLAERYFDTR